MNNKPEIIISENIAALTASFVDILNEHLQNKPTDEMVTLAVSGGSTPKALFQEIVLQHKNQIDWKRIKIFWSDERCVQPDANDSNYKMTRAYLLDKVPLPEENIFRIHGENDPKYEEERYSRVVRQQVQKKNNNYTFDLMMLGLGTDGHTASIFPGNEKLFKSEKLFVVAEHPDTGQQRISMTGKLINHASSIVFLVTGAKKATILRNITDEREEQTLYPASLVQPEDGKLIWLVDTEAAKYLKRDQ